MYSLLLLTWFLMTSPYGLAYVGYHSIGDAVLTTANALAKDTLNSLMKISLTIGCLWLASYIVKRIFKKNP